MALILPDKDEQLAMMMESRRRGFHDAVQELAYRTDNTPLGILHMLRDKVDDSRDPNVRITPDELAFVRRLSDFDLMMFISDVSSHGWKSARRTLWLIWEQPEYRKQQNAKGGRR
jgi:hypothetical protein